MTTINPRGGDARYLEEPYSNVTYRLRRDWIRLMPAESIAVWEIDLGPFAHSGFIGS